MLQLCKLYSWAYRKLWIGHMIIYNCQLISLVNDYSNTTYFIAVYCAVCDCYVHLHSSECLWELSLWLLRTLALQWMPMGIKFVIVTYTCTHTHAWFPHYYRQATAATFLHVVWKWTTSNLIDDCMQAYMHGEHISILAGKWWYTWYIVVLHRYQYTSWKAQTVVYKLMHRLLTKLTCMVYIIIH